MILNTTLLVGDCLERLRELPDASVQLCVTSPPYYNLRDYGTATWDGGDPDCPHLRGKLSSARSTLHPDPEKKKMLTGMPMGETCDHCGAKRVDAQIGLEASVPEYVEKLVDVFREVRRILADDGLLYLNLGDTYSHGTVGRNDYGPLASDGMKLRQGPKTGRHQDDPKRVYQGDRPQNARSSLPAKNLIGIPWRVAFALQDSGWILRSDIIWHKPSCMPEATKDRCTRAHEYVFMFSKSARYHYDAGAISEPLAEATLKDSRLDSGLAPLRNNRGYPGHGSRGSTSMVGASRKNKRTVWSVSPEPFKKAHFAVMPSKLVEPCVLAGSRISDVVLDPFSGAGTVGVVALRNGRRYIGIELNPAYMALAEHRLSRIMQPCDASELFSIPAPPIPADGVAW